MAGDDTSDIRVRIARALMTVNLAVSSRRPFLSRRYRYRRRSAMMTALGPSLAQPVWWPASDDAVEGDLATLFSTTQAVTKWTQYFDVYERLLAGRRSAPLRVLEIGVFRGGSLRMWKEYLAAGSTIVGIDIDPGCGRFNAPAEGVHVRIGGQEDENFLQSVVAEFGPFDVVIDDGSHMTSHMVSSFKALFPTGLVDGGAYVVEDIHANYWVEQADQKMTFADFARWMIDAMHAHYLETRSETEFRLGHPDRRDGLTVPWLTTHLDRIEFSDSIAVMHKRIRAMPRSERT